MATHKPIEVQELLGDLTPSSGDVKWSVIRTKHRMEKKLAEYAHKLGIHYYLPMTDSIKTYQYRKVKFTKPLFTGYIFIKTNYEGMKHIYNSGCVSTVLKIPSEKQLLDELQSLYNYRSRGAIMVPREYLEKGVEVVIEKGPFKGLKGYLESISNSNKLILNVDLLHQAVEITVSSSDVKVVYEN
ncbi:MAG: hypothetical protein JXR56_08685 [Candidatus Cloacimonetes bacterium]|nr:hypothetical protein [Candidatus Cloacimonadota bacterium]